MGLTQFETIYDAGILRASKTIAPGQSGERVGDKAKKF
jgi:hypothetical protein